MAAAIFLAGIFVGGQSRRMRGIPKGLLQPPQSKDELVMRLVRRLAEAECHDVVLVGNNAAYCHLNLPFVADAVPGRGPIAGLLGLARHARERRIESVLALACDMPDLSTGLIRRLMVDSPDADALVPKREYWEPLCARYRAMAVIPPIELLLRSEHARMTDLMVALGPGCVTMPLDSCECDQMMDWDSPGDLPDGVQYRGVSVKASEERS